MANLLQRARGIDPLRGLNRIVAEFVPRGPQGLTVLAIDGQWLKLVHVAGRLHARTITALLAKPIQGMSDEDAIAWLKQACAGKGFEAGALLIANPAPLTTARLFTLPSTDPAEIRDIVELQAEKHTPYAKEEILTDFRVLETDRAGYSRVLLVISHQDVVYRGLKFAEGLRWPLERVGFEVEGLVNWVRLAHGSSREDVLLVAELDRAATSVVIMHHGKPYFHRTLAFGVEQMLADPAEGPGKLVAEFQRTLEAFESEGLGVAASGVVLTGLVEGLADLPVRVQQGLELPTIVVPPFERIPLADPALAQGEAVKQVSFASMIGLALGSGDIDLTPKALKLHRAFEIRSKALVTVGMQVMAGLILVCVLVMANAYKSERHRAQLARDYAAMSPQAELIREELERLSRVKDWYATRTQLLDAIVEMNRLTPASIQWDAVTYANGEDVVVKGVSQELPRVFDFVAALRRSSVCAQVESRRVTKRRVDNQDVAEFEIICSFNAAEPAPPAEAGS